MKNQASLETSSFQKFGNSLTIPTSDLVKVYKEKSLVLDKQVTFEQAGKTYTGVAKEIGDKGQLLVLTDDGREKWLTAGEVSLTSW